MRKLFTIILCIASLSNYAQEPTVPAAKTYYNGLIKLLDKIDKMDIEEDEYKYNTAIEQVGQKLEMIMKIDESYDVSNLAGRINGIITKWENGSNESETSREDMFKLIEEMQTIFKAIRESYFYGDELTEKGHKEYAALCADFLNKDAQSRIEKAKQLDDYRDCKGLTEERDEFDERAEDIKEEFDESISQEISLKKYYLAKRYLIYWETAMKCMPDESLYAKNYEIASSLVKEMGDVDDVKSKTEENLNTKLLSVEVPNAVRKDGAIENLFKQAFTETGWNESVLKINLQNNDWIIERNKVTGIIICRYQNAVIVAKNENGECILYNFSMQQSYDGSSYQSSARRRSHNAKRMACENVPK